MPTLRDIKSHMQSVSSISKVTKAMQVVAAAKSHRLKSRVDDTRNFSERSWEVLAHLAEALQAVTDDDPVFGGYADPGRLGVILMTSNRGMVGAFDQMVIAQAENHISQRGLPAQAITIGRVGREHMRRRGFTILADYSTLDDRTSIDELTPLAHTVLDGFRGRVFDELAVVYTQFGASNRLTPTVRKLLPISTDHIASKREYIFEPDADELIRELLPRVIRFQLYEAFLESQTAENTARMIAMYQATRNADDLQSDLSRRYNKVRQQSITSELNDILGGSTD